MWLVYKHTSPSSKCYVGITSKTAEQRWGYNGNNYRKNGHHAYFVSAIDKYGWDNFNHEIILENVTESEAKYTEKYLIKWYKLHNLSYNITDGGDGTLGLTKIPWNKGLPCSEETKQKISTANKGKSSYWKGKHLSKETKIKISKSRLDKNYHPTNDWSKKEVVIYKDGIFVIKCKSVKEAALFLKVTSSYVCNCLKRNILCKKYKVSYVEIQ